MVWPDNRKYVGEFQANEIEGSGLLEWPDGGWYEGQFARGLRHGNGEYHAPEGEYVYTGGWKLGQQSG